MIESPLITSAGIVRHGFFTRAGGVSTGVYAALNCGYGSGDSRELVAENRARCAGGLGVEPQSLVTAYQVHGVAVVEVDAPWRPDEAPRADAMVTKTPGLALGILTADCAPVLMADAVAGIIGAAHAGWRGAKAGVIGALVDAMATLGAKPSRIVACVGPAIGPASYEVGEEFREGFVGDDPRISGFFTDAPGRRPHFDLPGFVVSRIEAAGIARIDQIAADTCADAARFFSYRRACLQAEGGYGRQLSAIALS